MSEYLPLILLIGVAGCFFMIFAVTMSVVEKLQEINKKIKYLDNENNRINNFLQVHDRKLQIADVCLLRLADAIVEKHEEKQDFLH